MLATYNIRPDEVGKLTQRQYSDLLSKVPAVITYQQTGKIVDEESQAKKKLANIAWARKQGLLKGKEDG